MTAHSATVTSIPDKTPVAPRAFPTTGFITIPDDEKLDEENWPWYQKESFYPVNIGETLHSRCQVLYKIGHGTTSTVWICRDLNTGEYVCVKSMVQDYPASRREVEAYSYLSQESTRTTSFGIAFVRQPLDQFQLRHDDHDYQFLVHEPLGLDLGALLVAIGGKYPLRYFNSLCADFIRALEFIHGAKVTHADIHPKNILFKIGDKRVLREWEEQEIAHPSARKSKGQWTIFAQKEIQTTDGWISEKSLPILCDFGEARSGQDSYKESIQIAEYRAPEVFLRFAWGTPVDVWSVGCMIWFVGTGQPLFPRDDDNDEEDPNADGVQLATMAMLLGPPPPVMLEGPRFSRYFNDDGSPKYQVPYETLESRFASAFGRAPPPEAAQKFVDFIRRVLQWNPHDRPTAAQLLADPWIVEE